MNVNGWLATRTPKPPPALTGRLAAALADRGGESERNAVAVLVDAAEASLGELLRRDSEGRESALDLLTVDALVTYAFEAASLDPESLPGRADDAMRRFAEAARS